MLKCTVHCTPCRVIWTHQADCNSMAALLASPSTATTMPLRAAFSCQSTGTVAERFSQSPEQTQARHIPPGINCCPTTKAKLMVAVTTVRYTRWNSTPAVSTAADPHTGAAPNATCSGFKQNWRMTHLHHIIHDQQSLRAAS
jgi:hypothetical protein